MAGPSLSCLFALSPPTLDRTSPASCRPGPRPEASPEPASGYLKGLTGTRVGCAAARGRACPGAGPQPASQCPGAQPRSAGCSGSGSQSQHHPGSEEPGRGSPPGPALTSGTPAVSVRRKGCGEPCPLPPDQPRAAVPALPSLTRAGLPPTPGHTGSLMGRVAIHRGSAPFLCRAAAASSGTSSGTAPR